MNTRKIILTLVIILGFGGTLYMLRGYLPSGEKTSEIIDTITDTSSNSTSSGPRILPYGNALDFKEVQKFNPEERLYQYPVVNTSEIGLALPEFIKPTQ